MKKILISLFIICSTQLLFAKGIIRGSIQDVESGDPVMGANIVIEGTEIGTTTDFDGYYSLQIPEGEHSIIVSAIGYQSLKIKTVNINANDIKLLNIVLKPSVEMLNEVVLTASNSRRTAAALLAIQRKSVKIINGISSETINKTGDTNVANALKRITGVSVEKGKYVYVRGLSDRYTKTTLNGVSIPGLDPDKNTVQMDLFPTNLVDNIVVYKTFSPDLPGDFTGGLVDIATKDFPVRKTFVISSGLGYSTGMNFNKNFVLYEAQSRDWIGLGYATRKLGFPENTTIPDESLNNPRLTELTNSFSKELGVKHGANTFLNQNYSLSYGNQYNHTKSTLGLLFAFNYKNDYTYYDNVYQGIFFKNTDNQINKLDKREVSKGSYGENNVVWSALLGAAIKLDKNKYSLSIFHSQNGKGQAADYIAHNFDETNATLYKDGIQYAQKSVTNIMLKGTHYIKDNGFKIAWKIAPTYSKILEPDVRSTRLSYDDTDQHFHLQLGDGAGIDRYYRDLGEINLVAKSDVSLRFHLLHDDNSKLKFGLSNTLKNRNYSIDTYTFSKTSDFDEFTEDPNSILIDEHIWNTQSQSGMFVKGFQDLNNQYNATSNIAAAYILNEWKIFEELKTIYGVRVEHAITHYKGYYNNATFNKQVLNTTNLLPSLNLIYSVAEKTNWRLSYSKTLARPSFKEKSNAHIADPISQNFFIGNLNLKETKISNIDIRWEHFMKKGQLISASGFYKNFTNPIEIVPFQLSPNNIQPKNTEQAVVYGGEVEIIKQLSKEKAKTNIRIGANLTYILSRVNTQKVIINNNGKTEYQLRKEVARIGEQVSKYRPMQGQSPFLFNANLNIKHKTFESNLSYNIQSRKLAIVGSGIVPDVYEDSFHSLNFKTSFNFGNQKSYKVSVSAKNILNDTFNQYYESYGASKEIYRSNDLARSFNLKITYTIH